MYIVRKYFAKISIIMCFDHIYTYLILLHDIFLSTSFCVINKYILVLV